MKKLQMRNANKWTWFKTSTLKDSIILNYKNWMQAQIAKTHAETVKIEADTRRLEAQDGGGQ